MNEAVHYNDEQFDENKILNDGNVKNREVNKHSYLYLINYITVYLLDIRIRRLPDNSLATCSCPQLRLPNNTNCDIP